MQSLNLTTVIAIYGAVLSTIAIGWNIYTYRQSQPSMSFSVEFVPVSPSGIAFKFIFRSKGYSSIFVEQIDLYLDSGQKVTYTGFTGPGSTKALEVTYEKPEVYYLPLWNHMREIEDPTRTKRIEIRDTQGRVYNYPPIWFWKQREFRNQIKSNWTKKDQEYWKSRPQT
jgi:hypothetical protein